jgi:hypothetical protein
MRMLWILILLLSTTFFILSNQTENNDFYDNTPAVELKGPGVIVSGEISNPGKVDLTRLKLRSLLVREAIFRESRTVFIGSYRYDGYSLFDILKERYVDKSNKDEFGSVIDMLVVVENDRGEKAVFSWGEIYYPSTLHRIILATRVSRIIPSKTGEKWPLPTSTRLVCANDLLSERNLERPTKITVMSCPLSFSGSKSGRKPLSDRIKLVLNGKTVLEITNLDNQLAERTYPSVFYGRGRGFHGIQNFSGKTLQSLLKSQFPFNRKNIRRTYFAVSASDGYRIVISFSELFNRNDQSDFLIIDSGKNSKKGRFRLFPTPDFFSDRAIYTIDAIHFLAVE